MILRYPQVSRVLACFAFLLMMSGAARSQNTLIHYWSFNKVTAAYHYPNFPILKADYSLVDTNKTAWVYAWFPGTSASYLGYYDNNVGDTTNARLGYPTGNSFRWRNPADSTEVRVYMPTTGYSNIVIKYALESSSTGSGDKIESFAYSTDSGITWKNKTNGLRVNGANVDTLLTTPTIYQGTSWGTVQIDFGTDTTVNNNPKLVFRIRLVALNTGTSGNNRFENFTVEGGTIPNVINITSPTTGDTVYSGDIDSIRFLTTGKIKPVKNVLYSLDGGFTYTFLTLMSSTGVIPWTVPYVASPTSQVLLQVLDSTTVGISRPFVIMPGRIHAPPRNLIHYWNFNSFAGSFVFPGVPLMNADYSVIDARAATLTYQLMAGVSDNYVGLLTTGPGDTTNTQMNFPGGRCLQINNPTDSVELRMAMATTGYRGITAHIAVQRFSTAVGPTSVGVQYSTDGGTTWKTSGLATVHDSIGASQFVSPNWGTISIDLTGDPAMNDNPLAMLKLTFTGNNSQFSGFPTATNWSGVRLDNISIEGTYVPAPTIGLMHYWNWNGLQTAYNLPNIPAFRSDYSDPSLPPAAFVYWLNPFANPLTYLGYLDNVAGDTTNSRFGAIGGNALRLRNPSDSMEMRFYVPTTGFKNIRFSYALQSSSVGSGQTTEFFDVSADSGATWLPNAAPALDVTDNRFQGANWGAVSRDLSYLEFLNDNPRTVFRIRFAGNTNKTSGNNRFDNICVEGVRTGAPPPKNGIYVNAPKSLDTVVGGTIDTMRFTIVGAVANTWTIELSLDSGQTWRLAGLTTASPVYAWSVPDTTVNAAKVRVSSADGVIGFSSGFFTILRPGVVQSVSIPPSIAAGHDVSIQWSAAGYLGATVDLDVSYDNKATWSPIQHGYIFGTSSNYVWTAPFAAHSGAIVRVAFAEGAVGYSQPFDIQVSGVAPAATSNISGPEVRPNPFGQATTITYRSDSSGPVVLVIHDLLGRECAREEFQSIGYGSQFITFDGTTLPVGSYTFSIRGSASAQGKFSVIR